MKSRMGADLSTQQDEAQRPSSPPPTSRAPVPTVHPPLVQQKQQKQQKQQTQQEKQTRRREKQQREVQCDADIDKALREDLIPDAGQERTQRAHPAL